MSDIKQQESKTQSFVRGAGRVNDPDNKLWAPARWVVQLIQYLIAILILTIGEGVKAIVSGKSPRKRNAHSQ